MICPGPGGALNGPGTSHCGIPCWWGQGTLVNGVCSIPNVHIDDNTNTAIIVTRGGLNGSTSIGILQATGSGVSKNGITATLTVQSLNTSGAVVTADQSAFYFLIFG